MWGRLMKKWMDGWMEGGREREECGRMEGPLSYVVLS